MSGNSPLAGCGPALEERTPAELRARYRAYRRRQARRLVRMLPREAIRPLYRRATRGVPRTVGADPMEELVRYCESLLPLPPFEVWAADRARSPEEHLRDLEDSADVPTPGAPTTIEVRRFERVDGPWIARLRGFRDGRWWRGFIAFEGGGSDSVHRTALIFQESAPTDLRERFLGFEGETLDAFLRSALPS